jgi:hypothetical protein
VNSGGDADLGQRRGQLRRGHLLGEPLGDADAGVEHLAETVLELGAQGQVEEGVHREQQRYENEGAGRGDAAAQRWGVHHDLMT